MNSLIVLSQVFSKDEKLLSQLELFANCGKMFGNQSILIHRVLNKFNILLKEHFEQQ
jgi:hypothetical protein